MSYSPIRPTRKEFNDNLGNIISIKQPPPPLVPVKSGGVIDASVDTQNIFNGAVNKRIYIPDGIYYIASSIDPSGFKYIEGSCSNKVIFITDQDISIFESPDTTDNNYLFIKGITLKQIGVSTKPAIKLAGKMASPYTGFSYSLLEDVMVDGFQDGFEGYGFWSTLFNRIRFRNLARHHIRLGSKTNNVIVKNSVLQNGVNGIVANNAIGGDGTQITSIHCDNLDCESMSGYLFDLYAVETFTASKLHTEGIAQIANIDSVANFVLEKSRLNAVTRVLTARKSNASVLFSGIPKILNNQITINTTGNIGLVQLSTSEIPAKLKWEGNDVQVTNGANVFVYNNDFNATTLSNHKRIGDTISTAASRFRYSEDIITHVFDLSRSREKYAKLMTAELECVGAGTAASATTVSVKDATGTAIFQGTIQAQAYATGDKINLGRTFTASEYWRGVVTEGTTWTVSHSNTTGVDALTFKVNFLLPKFGDEA